MPWALAAVAVLAAGAVAVVAWAMLRPVRFEGWGKFGAAALTFPLHVLVPAAGAVAAAVVAALLGAVVATVLFALLAAALAAMALGPVVALWRRARALAVVLSVREYLAFARRPNFGGPEPARTRSYGPGVVLDWWPAVGDGARPAVVKVHGGGWTSGTRGEASQWNRWLNALGYHVADVDYRLAPPPRWEDAVADVDLAVAWVAAHAGELDVDPARISLMGHSAGGHLALLAGYGGSARAVRCIVNIYGPSDPARLYEDGVLQDELRAFVGGSPGEYPDRYAAVSAVGHVTPGSPPTLTVHGRRDRLVPVIQAGLLARALAAAEVEHQTCVLPATDHSFDVNWGGFATQVARARIERFLDQANRA
jgi:acetyl esterase/lipase